MNEAADGTLPTELDAPAAALHDGKCLHDGASAERDLRAPLDPGGETDECAADKLGEPPAKGQLPERASAGFTAITEYL